MGLKRCPGSAAFTQPKIELVRCPHCGDDAEVWTDEAEGKCAKCGGAVCRTTTQSCIDWCKYARECLGDEAHKKYQDTKSRLRKEAFLKAAEHRLSDERDRRRARARVECAERLLSREAAADPTIVLACAALFDVNRLEPARAAVPGESEAVSPAAAILHELGYPEGFVKEVAGILHRLGEAGDADGVNGRVVREADRFAGGGAGA